MKTAASLVQQYLDNPKPRVVVAIPSPKWGTMSVTFAWSDGRWWLEMPANISAVEVDRINGALTHTGWALRAHEHGMPDILQEQLVRGE